MTSTESRPAWLPRTRRAAIARRTGDAPMSGEGARRRGSRGSGADARARDDRARTIERPAAGTDAGDEPDATLHGGQRAHRVVLTLGALRRVVDAGALGRVMRFEGRRRDPQITGMRERGGRVGRKLHAEQRARARAPPRTGGQHSPVDRHHRSATEAVRRKTRPSCRIQSSPRESIILMVFPLRRAFAGHVVPRDVQIGRVEARPDWCGLRHEGGGQDSAGKARRETSGTNRTPPPERSRHPVDARSRITSSWSV